jgi:peptidoglycan/LPS O-acetylase OafA/YrhL
MRILGASMLILGHSNPPGWLFQLRNFGTPLLIVVSAMSYTEIYAGRNIDIYSFYKKRYSRLIIPAWIFLTFMFLFFHVFFECLHKDYPFSSKIIVDSYTFYGGIGFLWVFKIYIVLAILTPILLKINSIPVSNTRFFLILLALYMAYELSQYLVITSIPPAYVYFFNTTIFTFIPYTILFLYGMRLGSLSNKQILYAIVASLILFIILASAAYTVTGHFIKTEAYKYPPKLYYLSYAFLFLIWCISCAEIYLLC